MPATGREATAVLVLDGEVLGALPPVRLEMPWWPEAHDLVTAVRERDGLDITVLRLLGAISDTPFGGSVVYLAETDRAPRAPLDPWSGDPLTDHPLRQTWARPGGPAELLAWADDRLAEHGVERTGPGQQMRTWNLSALWRIPTADGRVWLKAVPQFFAHEGAVIDWVGAPAAPRLIASAPARTLMTEIAGEPNHGVREEAALHPMIPLLTGLQQRALGRLDELRAIGIPDRGLPMMVPRIPAVVQDLGAALDRAERRVVDALVDGLADRFTDVAACGVPDTLVHGDFHPGNVAGPRGAYAILDWGDSFLGHPLLDELAFTERLGTADRHVVRGWFVAEWQRIVPGADPGRAADLLEPVVPLLTAVMYADFCAAIEPDERIYHESDAARMLRRAASHDPGPAGLR